MFKILVVEDDRDLNRTVCTFLGQSGYQATGCLSADEAYDAMYETVFDLIVSIHTVPPEIVVLWFSLVCLYYIGTVFARCF